MKYQLAAKAQEDLRNAMDFYESQRVGLGYEFVIEVGVAIGTILEAPLRWSKIDEGVRKYRLDRFPFAILYRVPNGAPIHVVAIFDLRRQSGSWRR